MKNNLDEAYLCMEQENYQEAIQKFLSYLKECPNDYEAQFHLARAYTQVGDFNQSFLWCKKAADDGNIPGAQALLALHYCKGAGVAKSGPDAIHYLKLVGSCQEPSIQDNIHLCQGILHYTGLGVKKDMSQAYRHFKKAHNMELANEYTNAILQHYPMDEEGTIDLEKKKRSRWATLFLILTLVNNLLLGMNSYIMWQEGTTNITGFLTSLLLLIIPIGLLAWQRWAFIGALGISILVFPVSILTLILSGPTHLISILFSNIFLYWASMGTLLIRKDGYAHPWCSLSGKADNGCNPVRRLADHILCYGEGSAYQTASPEMKKYHYVFYAITALMSILAIGSAIQVFRTDIGWEVEWNIFESPGLWGTFSFIGFFLQFFNWQHTSFEHATEVTFQDGSKKTYKSRDIMDTMEGQFLWPLLSHLIIIPAFYGAAIYYILMIILALISSVVPYLLGGAVIGSMILYFKWGKGLNQRKYRYALLTLITVLFGVVFGTILIESGTVHLAETVTANASKQFLKCVGNQVNLRQQPTTDSPKLYVEASCSGEVYFNAKPEQYETPCQLSANEIVEVTGESGDWYQLAIRGTTAYAMKKFLIPVFPDDIEEARRTNAQLNQLYTLRSSGKFKRQYIYYEENEMDGATYFYFGKKEGKGIRFTHSTFISWDGQLATYNSKKFQAEYPQWPTEQMGGRNHLQIEKMTDEQLNKIFQTASPTQAWVYYFADINNVIWFYE